MQVELVFVPAPTEGLDVPSLGDKRPVTTNLLEGVMVFNPAGLASRYDDPKVLPK